MGKKRPIFEYKGFQGLLDVFNRSDDPRSPVGSYHSQPWSSETPRQPSSHSRHYRQSQRSHRHRSSQHDDSVVSSRRRNYERHSRHRRHGGAESYGRRRDPNRRILYTDDTRDMRDDVLRRRPRPIDNGDFPAGFRRSRRMNGTESSDAAPMGYDGAYDAATRAVDPEFEQKYAHDVEAGLLPGSHADPGRTDSLGHRRAHSEDGRRSHHTRTLYDERDEADSYDGMTPPRHRRHTHNGSTRTKRSKKRRGIFSVFGGASSSSSEDYDENGSPTYSKPYTEAGGRKRKRGGVMRNIAIAATVVTGLIAARRIYRHWNEKGGQGQEDNKTDSESDGDGDDSSQGDGNLVIRGKKPLGTRTSKYGPIVTVPQNEAMIVERGGKFKRKLTAGNNFVVPIIERVAHQHSLREAPVPIEPQQCFSRDNISVVADALMFIRVEDPVSASYEVDDLLRSMNMLAIATLKKEIGRLLLDELFADRVKASERISQTINEACRPWGVRCTRFDLQDLDIPNEVRASIGRTAEAERLRRADILFSEGQRDALINKAEGEMQAQIRMSQARQMDIVNQAIGEAHAIQERGEAIANAMRDVAEAINEPGGEQALRLRIAEQYLNACALAKGDREDGVVHDPANIAAAMRHTIGLLSVLGDPSANASNPYVVRPGPDPGPGPGPDSNPGYGADYGAGYGAEYASHTGPLHGEGGMMDEVGVNGYDSYSRPDAYAEHSLDGSAVEDRLSGSQGRTSFGRMPSRNSSPVEVASPKPHGFGR